MDLTLGGVTDATGIGSVTYYHTFNWVRDITQIAIATVPVQGGCIAKVYVNGVFKMVSYRGSGDQAQGSPSIRMKNGDYLTVAWENGPPSGTISAVLTYEDTYQ